MAHAVSAVASSSIILHHPPVPSNKFCIEIKEADFYGGRGFSTPQFYPKSSAGACVTIFFFLAVLFYVIVSIHFKEIDREKRREREERGEEREGLT